MKKIVHGFIFLLFISRPLSAASESLQFPDDLPGPKELMDSFFRPMQEFSFAIVRGFTITRRGQDCRLYTSHPIEITACIQNTQKNGHWMQRLTYLSHNLPITIMIEHTETLPISHDDLWNWRFPFPSGSYYSFSIPVFGLSVRYEQNEKGVIFNLTYAEKNLFFLETAASQNKITRVYQGSFFQNLSQCQVTVTQDHEVQNVSYQIDQGQAMSPYLFRQQCTASLIEQFTQVGQYFITRFATHVST